MAPGGGGLMPKGRRFTPRTTPDGRPEKGRCWWCASKLVQQWNEAKCLNCGTVEFWHGRQFNTGPNQACDDWQSAGKTKRYPAPGRYGDGFFCGLRCGFQYAQSAAKALTQVNTQEENE